MHTNGESTGFPSRSCTECASVLSNVVAGMPQVCVACGSVHLVIRRRGWETVVTRNAYRSGDAESA